MVCGAAALCVRLWFCIEFVVAALDAIHDNRERIAIHWTEFTFMKSIETRISRRDYQQVLAIAWCGRGLRLNGKNTNGSSSASGQFDCQRRSFISLTTINSCDASSKWVRATNDWHKLLFLFHSIKTVAQLSPRHIGDHLRPILCCRRLTDHKIAHANPICVHRVFALRRYEGLRVCGVSISSIKIAIAIVRRRRQNAVIALGTQHHLRRCSWH